MVFPDRFQKSMHHFASNTWQKNSKLLHWFKIHLVCPSISLKWKFQKVKFCMTHEYDVTHNQLRIEITVFDWSILKSLSFTWFEKNHILFDESFIMSHLYLSLVLCRQFEFKLLMAPESINHVKLFTHLYIDEATRQKRPKSSSFHCEGNLGK